METSICLYFELIQSVRNQLSPVHFHRPILDSMIVHIDKQIVCLWNRLYGDARHRRNGIRRSNGGSYMQGFGRRQGSMQIQLGQ